MKFIPTAVTHKLGRQILTAQKHAPKALFVAGIVGVVGSTVLACRATLRLPQVLDDMKFDIDEVKKIEPAIDKPGMNYTSTMHNKNLVYVYSKGTYRIVKLYGPSILLGAASLTALTTSHVTLTRRNSSLTAAYSALHAGYEAYRGRVREEIGVERELDIYQNATRQIVTIDGENHEMRVVGDPTKHSVYARFFDESSTCWQKNAELNRAFLQCQQNYANHRLTARGHVFLNEVYDMLGLERSAAGQCVGWVTGNGGDNYIDFGIFDVASARFVNNLERSILLDFNVDGNILGKM